MEEQGGMRMDEVLISLKSYSYRLRMAVCLLEEHNTTVLRSRATDYAFDTCRELLKGAEDATAAIRHEVSKAEAQARLGQDQW